MQLFYSFCNSKRCVHITKVLLALLSDPSDFIEHYVNLMKNDENVKYPQQAAWNEIISKLNL